MIIHRGARGACWPLVGVFLAVWLDPMHGIRTRGSPASRLLFALRDGATAGRPRPRDHRDPRQCPHSARNALACPGALRQRYKSVHLRMVLSEGEEYGNPNAGGAGFKRLSGKRRVVDPQKREVEWQEWLDSLSPEERATVEENERLTPLNAHEWNVTERAREKGCGFFDEHGKFIEGAAGRSTVWDKDPDNRWILHQCPISELPAAILDKDRFLHQHPGWFRDRSVFESVYLGMVKKKLNESLSDFEYAELARLYMRYQHVLTAEPLCGFIEYFLLQRGISLQDLFLITTAIHDVGTVYDFDPLGRSKSSGIGDMALEIIREEEDDNLAQDPAKPGMNVESNGNELDAQLSDDNGTGNEQDGLGAFTPDNTIDADLPDP